MNAILEQTFKRRAPVLGSAKMATEKSSVCRHWLRYGGYCQFGSQCQFEHPAVTVQDPVQSKECKRVYTDPEERKVVAAARHEAWRKWREERARQQASGARDAPVASPAPTEPPPPSLPSVSSTRRRVSRPKNGSRAAGFCRWLLNTFGKERLDKPGSCGVIDVAGGRGDCSFQLCTLRDIPCVVIDPRTPNFERVMSRYSRDAVQSRKGLRHQDHDLCSPSLLSPSCSSSPAVPESAVASSAPKSLGTVDIVFGYHDMRARKFPSSLACCFPVPYSPQNSLSPDSPDHLAQRSPQFLQHIQSFDKFYKHYIEQINQLNEVPPAHSHIKSESSHEAKASHEPSCESPPPQQNKPSEEQIRACLESCSVLVGMHSDQATEPLVDFALMHDKSFAVIPCCVFPELFPFRFFTTPDGKQVPVRTYEQFCQYLMQKDSRIKQTELDFEGRNTVLYLIQ